MNLIRTTETSLPLLPGHDFSSDLKKKTKLFKVMNKKIYKSLDLSGFIVPNGIVKQWQEQLEDILGHYVVCYDSRICNLDIPLEAHLCAIVKGADLTEKQKEILNYYEQISKKQNITFVVYNNPLTYINRFQTEIYKLYVAKGKL